MLFIHGFPDLPQNWAPQLQACAEAGYHAVAVTSRGYEASSQPADGSYHLASLAADVPAWLDSLGKEQAHVVGHDWGAAIAVAAAAAYPERLKSLCAMAVPHPGRFSSLGLKSPRQLWMSRYILFFQLRGIAERSLRRGDYAFVDRLWQRWSPGWRYGNALTNPVRERLARPGVLDAALRYYRHGLETNTSLATATTELLSQPVRVPCLALSGALDGCIDADVFRRCMQEQDFPELLRVKTLDGLGHFLHLEAPDRINAELLGWLSQHEA